MSNFEFVFSLFGLLLGFSLVEVLGGLGKAVKAARPAPHAGQARVSIGWLTPLLGLVVMLDLTSFWIVIWQARAVIPPTFESLMLGLLICGLYYLAAMLVFPERPEEWGDLDAYYRLHRRQVTGGVALCNLLAHGASAFAGTEPPPDAPRLAVFVIFYTLLGGIAFTSSKRAGIAMLSAMIALYVLSGPAVRLAG